MEVKYSLVNKNVTISNETGITKWDFVDMGGKMCV